MEARKHWFEEDKTTEDAVKNKGVISSINKNNRIEKKDPINTDHNIVYCTIGLIRSYFFAP